MSYLVPILVISSHVTSLLWIEDYILRGAPEHHQNVQYHCRMTCMTTYYYYSSHYSDGIPPLICGGHHSSNAVNILQHSVASTTFPWSTSESAGPKVWRSSGGKFPAPPVLVCGIWSDGFMLWHVMIFCLLWLYLIIDYSAKGRSDDRLKVELKSITSMRKQL